MGGKVAAAFRAYADHLDSDEFQAGFAELVGLSTESPTAIMCSEALWWRCHRRLIADVLVSRGAEVVHVLTADRSQVHVLRPPARLRAGRLVYSASPAGDADEQTVEPGCADP